MSVWTQSWYSHCSLDYINQRNLTLAISKCECRAKGQLGCCKCMHMYFPINGGPVTITCVSELSKSNSMFQRSLPHQVKTQLSTNIKHRRYIHLMWNFLPIHFHTKRLYVHMDEIVDTLFSYGRWLIVC